MSDRFPGYGDITSGHPTTRNLDPESASRSTVTPPISATYPADADQPSDSVAYGPDIPTEAQFRLLGNLAGKRVLQLGCGSGAAAVALTRLGARVISVDPSLNRIETAKANAESAEVKLEVHQSDLAELPFLSADSMDLALSIYALANVDDISRVFRQVHRVLHTGHHLVFSVPHPSYVMLDPDSGDPPAVTRSYFDRSARPWATDHDHGEDRPRSISELFTCLTRANFRTDTLLEPEPETRQSQYWRDAMGWAPATLIVRATKEGN